MEAFLPRHAGNIATFSQSPFSIILILVLPFLNVRNAPYILDVVFLNMTDFCPSCNGPVPPQATRCPACSTPLSTGITGGALPAGTSLKNGEYIIKSVLGQGGFGITYLAVKQKLNKRFAIKELFPWGSSRHSGGHVHPAIQDFQKLIQDFLHEAHLLKEVDSHRNIVDVIDYFEENGTVYVVMQYIEGDSLEKVIESYPKGISEEKALRYMKHIADALHRVHEKGILHRDIKPSNILIERHSDEAHLIDFGAARAVSFRQAQHLTVIVTPGYAAPEQYVGEAKFGPELDIYGFGATFYHALAGQPPVNALARVQAMENGTDLYDSLRKLRPDLHPLLTQMIDRCLQVEVSRRPHSAEELLRVIEEVERANLVKNQPSHGIGWLPQAQQMSPPFLPQSTPPSPPSLPQRSAISVSFPSASSSASSNVAHSGGTQAQQASPAPPSTQHPPSSSPANLFRVPVWVILVAAAILLLFIVLAELYEPKQAHTVPPTRSRERFRRPSRSEMKQSDVFLYHADRTCTPHFSCCRRVALV